MKSIYVAVVHFFLLATLLLHAILCIPLAGFRLRLRRWNIISLLAPFAGQELPSLGGNLSWISPEELSSQLYWFSISQMKRRRSGASTEKATSLCFHFFLLLLPLYSWSGFPAKLSSFLLDLQDRPVERENKKKRRRFFLSISLSLLFWYSLEMKEVVEEVGESGGAGVAGIELKLAPPFLWRRRRRRGRRLAGSTVTTGYYF